MAEDRKKWWAAKNKPQYLAWISSIDQLMDEIEKLRYHFADSWVVLSHNPVAPRNKGTRFCLP